MLATAATVVEEARLASRALLEFATHLVHPTVRLGVTGLSGAGKTVFITALVHALLHGGRLPLFEPLSTGRIAGARLRPQPDDAVPRFEGEARERTLILDIVDYPGEWLLDLPLLSTSYAQWSRQALALSRMAPRDALA